jgi:hypothetical protein
MHVYDQIISKTRYQNFRTWLNKLAVQVDNGAVKGVINGLLQFLLWRKIIIASLIDVRNIYIATCRVWFMAVPVLHYVCLYNLCKAIQSYIYGR